MIHFDLPKEKSSIIKVIGVGGGGSNAVNHMFSQSIDGVNFIICNTDAQAISQSTVPNKIQLGPHLTQGLGAGANPKIGEEACQESLEEIKRILEVNTKMAFITAGMGGGTGTGGAPIIAKICKDLGILTVGIVTTPFGYEGRKRIAQAEEGIEKLKSYVDTLLVISNDKLRHQFGNLTMKAAFAKADNVLATAAKCITDVINSTGQINVDFADVCTVMRNGGVAILGSAAVEGENRAQKAIENALNSPLLNDNDIRGAKWILININSAEGEHEFTMDEVETIQNHLLSQAGDNTDVILGLGYDNTLGEKIGITLIATGFEHKNPFDKKVEPVAEPKKEEKIIMTLATPEEDTRVYAREKLVQQTIELQEEKPLIKEEPAPLKFELKPEAKVEDEFMPVLKEVETKPVILEKPEEVKEEKPIYLEMAPPEANPVSERIQPVYSTPPQPRPVVVEKKSEEPVQAKVQEDKPSHTEETKNPPVKQEPQPTPSSGGYLARPAHIYVDETQAKAPETKPQLQVAASTPEEDPELEMKLVLKDADDVAEPTQQAAMPTMSVPEDLPPIDENEEMKRRAMERIAKLRNLSFNINSADPNNEFETVPAYLRRNTELHNRIADVESFYTNYTVKTSASNQAEISTLNSFLDGKKPD
jgi:cell division protein FtsZ